MFVKADGVIIGVLGLWSEITAKIAVLNLTRLCSVIKTEGLFSIKTLICDAVSENVFSFKSKTCL